MGGYLLMQTENPLLPTAFCFTAMCGASERVSSCQPSLALQRLSAYDCVFCSVMGISKMVQCLYLLIFCDFSGVKLQSSVIYRLNQENRFQTPFCASESISCFLRMTYQSFKASYAYLAAQKSVFSKFGSLKNPPEDSCQMTLTF